MIPSIRTLLTSGAGKIAAFAMLAGLIAGCGGYGQRQSMPGAAAPVSVYFRVRVSSGATASGGAAPQYINPTKTQSMLVRVYSNQPFTGQVYETVIQNLTPATSPYCTTDSSGTNCMFPLNLPPGNYVCNVATYAGPDAHGTVLSIQYNVFFTVPAGGNGNPAVIPWTLYGVPESVSMTAAGSGVQTNGSVVTLSSGSPVRFSLGAFDATGARIVGAGAPAWTVTSSNPGFILLPPTTQSPNTMVLQPPRSNTPSTTQVGITATYPPDETRTVSSPCLQPKAVCSAAMTVNFRNFAADDWTTFAHDQLRSGFQTQSTGISASNVPTLALRWKITLPSTYNRVIDPSPVVYNGNVIVVTNGGYVYDLSAVDGSIVWSQFVGGSGTEVIATPTIDPASNLVFIGNRLITSIANPSYVYAFHLQDGSLAWKAQVPGLTHAGPVVANGAVYIGTSGGDPPQCLNAGVTALNELDGSPKWTWYVNSAHNPGGGGSVWGVISFDGSRLIFGTGNTCQTPVTTSNGAVALDLNGNVLWNFVAIANSTADYDTGGGVMISNGDASFLNKNGTLYTLRAGSGSVARQTVVNPYTGYGYFASPTTDGATTLIGAGMFYCPDNPPGCPTSSIHAQSASAKFAMATNQRRVCVLIHRKGAHPLESINGWVSFLRAVDSSGGILWSKQMNTGIESYAAIHNGLAFAGIDSSVAALDMHTGHQLWSAPTADVVVGGPVVVPSGVYAADESGSVYAYALPYSTTARAKVRNRILP